MSKSFPQPQFVLVKPLGHMVYSGTCKASDFIKSGIHLMRTDDGSQESSQESEEDTVIHHQPDKN